MNIRRLIQLNIRKQILDSKLRKKILIIYGARQVGKTTLVKEIIKDFPKKTEYYNCDYIDVQNMFSYENTGNLSMIVKNIDLLVLDEAQRIKNIGIVLKILADEFPNLQIIATGSSSFDLSNKINEPLTGRKIIYQLFPFSFEEYTSQMNLIEKKRSINQILRFGLYPSVILESNENAVENLKEITSSYLFKDIFNFQNLKNPDILSNLLKLLAFQVGNEVSYTELSRKIGIDQSVVQRYIHLLEESFILFRLPALKRNLRNEIGKSRKIFFWDIGIRNMIIQNTNTLDFRNDIGALWENFCISERIKHLNYSRQMYNFYFWRNYSQKEIDYVEEIGETFYAYEFKWSSKKNAKLPNDFSKSYPNHKFNIVNPENFTDKLFNS